MTRTRLFTIAFTISVVAAIVFATKSVASPPAVEGIIVAIDVGKQRIRVVNNDADNWFACTRNTKVTLNGYAATFNQLAIEQTAKVSFDPYSYEALRVDATPRPGRVD